MNDPKKKAQATPKFAAYRPSSNAQFLLTAGTSPKNNSALSEIVVPCFQVSNIFQPHKGPTIDILSALKPLSQITTPIREEDWTAFRQSVMNANRGSMGCAQFQRAGDNGVKEESKANLSPFCSKAPDVQKSAINATPAAVTQAKTNFVTGNARTISLLIPSQKCLKKSSRRVSSFLDQDDATVASAALIAGLEAIEEAKKKEEAKIRAREKNKLAGRLNSGKISTTQKNTTEKKMLPKKTVAKCKPGKTEIKEVPTTPPRTTTFAIPMSPHKEIQKSPDSESPMENTIEEKPIE